MVTTRASKSKVVGGQDVHEAPPTQLREQQVLTTRSPPRLTSKDVSSFPLPDDDEDQQPDAADHKATPMQDEPKLGLKQTYRRTDTSGKWLSPKLLLQINIFLITLITVAFVALAPILPSSLPHICSSIIPPLTQTPHKHPLDSLIAPSLRPHAMTLCQNAESKLSSSYKVALSEAKRLGSEVSSVASSVAAKIVDSKIVVPFMPQMKDGYRLTVGDILIAATVHVQTFISSIEDMLGSKEAWKGLPTYPTSTAWLQKVLGEINGYDVHAWDAMAAESFAKQKAFVILLSCSDNDLCGRDLAEQIYEKAKRFEMPLYEGTDEEAYHKISCAGLFLGSNVGSGDASGAELQKSLGDDFLRQRCPASLQASPLIIFDSPDKIQSLKAIQVLNNLLSESGGLTFGSDSLKSPGGTVVRTGTIFVFTMSTHGSKLKDSDPKAILAARLFATLKPERFVPLSDATEAEIEEGKAEHERKKENVKATILGLRRRIDATNV